MADAPSRDSAPRTILVAVAVVLLFSLLLLVFAFPLMGMLGWWSGGYGGSMGGYGGMMGSYGGMMGSYGGMMGGYGGAGLSPLWGVGMLLLFLLVLLAVGYLLYRALVGSRHGAPADPALEELRHAYARGDLTDAEYEERRERLERDDGRTD